MKLLTLLLKMGKTERENAIESHNGLGSYLKEHGFDKVLDRATPSMDRAPEPLGLSPLQLNSLSR